MHSIIGRTVRDVITGFTGTVTGRVEYITGCNQLLVAPAVKEDGSLVASEWLDEQRALILGNDRVELNNSRSPGADRPAPRRL